MTSQMRIKTAHTDVTFDVNPGVAQQMTSLVRQHPQTTVVTEIPYPEGDGADDARELRRQLNAVRRERDRAEERLQKANYFIVGLREGIEIDRAAGVHPGAILRQAQESLNTHRANPYEYATTGYGTGLRSDTISFERRRQARREQFRRAAESTEQEVSSMREVVDGINDAAQNYVVRMNGANLRFTQLASYMETATEAIAGLGGRVAPTAPEGIEPF